MLTEQEVKERATSPEAALDVSIQHHEENLELSEAEAKGLNRYEVLGEAVCGLCLYHNNCCDHCVLRIEGVGCGDNESQYRKTLVAFEDFKINNGSFSAYRIEQFKMVELLKRLKRENCGKCKCEKKVKLRHGDYGENDGGDIRVFIGNKHFGICGDETHVCRGLSEDHIWGNIIDDLKRNSEDLRKFSAGDFGRLRGRIDASGQISLSILGHNDNAHPDSSANRTAQNWYFSLGRAKELHQKLGQMIATARRRSKK